MKTTPRTTVTAMRVLTVPLDAALCANAAGIEDIDACIVAVAATGSLMICWRFSIVHVVCRVYIGLVFSCPVLKMQAMPVDVLEDHL